MDWKQVWTIAAGIIVAGLVIGVATAVVRRA